MNQWAHKWQRTALSTLAQWAGNKRGQKSSSKFNLLFSQLDEEEGNLAQGSAALESLFLTTCAELETLNDFGSRFVKQIEKLVGLATGTGCEETVFAGAIRVIEQATHFLVRCQDETDQMLGLLANYNTQIESLLRIEAELQRTMWPLNFMQTLFKVESAPLGSEVQQMFGALTEEIEGLHGRVKEIFGTKFKQLEETRQTIARVIVQLHRQICSLRKTTAEQQAQVESSLGTLKKEMSANRERDVVLSRLSRNLAREVEQVVIGLQFQDIVNQKIQHITGALPQIKEKFAEFNLAADSAAAAEPMQYLRQLCRVEAGQLLAAQADLVRAESGIQTGIEKVLTYLTDMDSESLSLAEFKLLTTSFDGIVHVLLTLLHDLRPLVSTTVTSVADAYRMLQPLGTLASDLTAIVRDISARIHLIALNSQVQAAHAALDHRGVGLEVLSTRTSEISGETNRISEEAASQLDALVVGLAQTVKAFGQLQSDGLRQQTILDQQGHTEEQGLHAFRDDALTTLREIGDSLDSIRGQAHRTLDTLQFGQFHQVTLPGLRAPLVAIAECAETWLQGQGRKVDQACLIEGFKREYTMESEREVFARALADQPAPVSVLPQEPSAESFLDAEQLKKDHHAVPAPVASEPGELGANVELF